MQKDLTVVVGKNAIGIFHSEKRLMIMKTHMCVASSGENDLSPSLEREYSERSIEF